MILNFKTKLKIEMRTVSPCENHPKLLVTYCNLQTSTTIMASTFDLLENNIWLSNQLLKCKRLTIFEPAIPMDKFELLQLSRYWFSFKIPILPVAIDENLHVFLSCSQIFSVKNSENLV